MKQKYFGSNLGLTVLTDNPATSTKGMSAFITDKFNTGYMVGDIGLATLADTVAETVTEATAFSDDFTSGALWTNTSSGTGSASISGGVATLTAADASNRGRFALTSTVPLVVGKTYVLEWLVVSGTASSQINLGVMVDKFGATVVGKNTVSFIATASAASLSFNVYTAGTVVFDNISVKLAEPDRSVKNNGLIINGTLNKTPVASLATLISYSGFSLDANGTQVNGFGQTNATLGALFSTDFSLMFWHKPTSMGLRISTAGPHGYPYTGISGTGVLLELLWNGFLTVSNVAAGVRTQAVTPAHTPALDWSLYVISRVGNVFSLSHNNVLVGSVTFAASAVGDGLWVSCATSLSALALLRISATAPSADQIAQIYRDELPLFQPGAQCTIAGTSTAVTAMDYDSTTDLLHVGTSWGRTSFKGLLQVDSEATTVGSITSIAASGGMVVTSGINAKLSAPSIVVRDALKNEALAAKALSKTYYIQDLTIASFTGATTNGSTAVTASSISTAPYAPYVGMIIAGTGIVAGTFITAISGSAYTLSVAATTTGSAAIVQSVIPVTRGYTVKIVSKNGVPIREATTGVYWTRSNDGYIEYVTPSVAPTAGDWFSFEIVRS